ncbi:hypothetical protein ACHAXT_010771 [Thalassiosira profunda]
MECNERVLSFIAEWYDPAPQVTKQYLLKLHCHSNEVEMRDIQTKRSFLKRTKLPPTLLESDFSLGANIVLLSRDLRLTHYGDSITRGLLEGVEERTVCILPPALYESLGDIVMLIERGGFTLVDLKSTCLDAKDAEATAELLRVDPTELLQPARLVALSCRGANCVEAVNRLVQSSSFAGLGLACPANAEEALAYENFFLKRSSRSTATYEDCTCCVVKPHAIKERNVGAILKDIVSRGFVISALSAFRLERSSAAEFLEVYDGVVPPAEYIEMVDEMCSGPVVAMEVRLKPTVGDRQEEIVDKFRAHAGPWDTGMAKELYPDTLRGKFGRSKVRNAVHCTDLPKDGVMEGPQSNTSSRSWRMNGRAESEVVWYQYVWRWEFSALTQEGQSQQCCQFSYIIEV